MWKWNENELGRMYFDSDLTLFLDGNGFKVRVDGNPDDEKIKTRATNLETWLIENLTKHDPEKLRDGKWRNRNLWHELMRVTQVNNFQVVQCSIA